LQCVFHGIRFKVNKDWMPVMGSQFFFVPNSSTVHYYTLLYELQINRNLTLTFRTNYIFVPYILCYPTLSFRKRNNLCLIEFIIMQLVV